MPGQTKADDITLKASQQLMDIYISPEIQRRQGAGQLPSSFRLRAAQIVWFPDGRPREIRLNAEVKAAGEFVLKPGVSKKPGEAILQHEIKQIASMDLRPEERDCGHATFLKYGDQNQWCFSFDARYNRALSGEHVKTAKQFYESAKLCLTKGYMAPFIDNLFSAAELAAKSLLLAIPDPKFRKKASHRAITRRFHRHAHIGNARRSYNKALNQLSRLRDQGRYLKGTFHLSKEDAEKLATTVKRMVAEASRNT